MKLVHLALAAVFGFAWKCGVIVIAVALLGMMVSSDAEDGRADSVERDSTRYVAMIEGESAGVAMDIPDGKASSRCMLVGEDGRQLLHATYDRSGCLWIRWGDAFPIQPSSLATRDGAISLVARDGMQLHEFMLRPNGVSGLRTCDYARREYRGLGYSGGGDLVVDPWAIGEIANGGAVSSGDRAATSSPAAKPAPPAGSRAAAR